MKLRIFETYDWEDFAGAEEFPNGDQPIILESDYRAIVVDAGGYSVCEPMETTEDGEPDVDGCWDEVPFVQPFWSGDCALIWLVIKGIIGVEDLA